MVVPGKVHFSVKLRLASHDNIDKCHCDVCSLLTARLLKVLAASLIATVSFMGDSPTSRFVVGLTIVWESTQ